MVRYEQDLNRWFPAETDEKGRTGGEKDHDLDHVFQHAFKYRTSGASTLPLLHLGHN